MDNFFEKTAKAITETHRYRGFANMGTLPPDYILLSNGTETMSYTIPNSATTMNSFIYANQPPVMDVTKNSAVDWRSSYSTSVKAQTSYALKKSATSTFMPTISPAIVSSIFSLKTKHKNTSRWEKIIDGFKSAYAASPLPKITAYAETHIPEAVMILGALAMAGIASNPMPLMALAPIIGKIDVQHEKSVFRKFWMQNKLEVPTFDKFKILSGRNVMLVGGDEGAAYVNGRFGTAIGVTAAFGHLEKPNEDGILIKAGNEQNGRWDYLSVVDGMGGMGHGDEAAKIVALEMAGLSYGISVEKVIKNSIRQLSEKLPNGSGATYVGAIIEKDSDGNKYAYIITIGDSQAVIIDKNGRIKYISRPMSFPFKLSEYINLFQIVSEIVGIYGISTNVINFCLSVIQHADRIGMEKAKKIIESIFARYHQNSMMVMSALSSQGNDDSNDDEVEYHIDVVKLSPYDEIILASDGIFDNLTPHDVAHIMKENFDSDRDMNATMLNILNETKKAQLYRLLVQSHMGFKTLGGKEMTVPLPGKPDNVGMVIYSTKD